MPGKDIFLSYASEDREAVLPLVHALEGTGWTVFWDRTIPTGKTWRQVVGEELKRCRSMVVVWSRASVQKEWVLEEAERGKTRRILYPVLIDRDVELPLGFGYLQAADLVNWDGSTLAPAFQRLVADISALLGNPSPKFEQQGRPQIQRQDTSLAERRTKSPPLLTGAKTETPPARVRWMVAFGGLLGILLFVLTVSLKGPSASPIVSTVEAPPAATTEPTPSPTPEPTPAMTVLPTPAAKLDGVRPAAREWLDKGSRALNADDAIRSYTEAIRLEPNFADAYFNRGVNRYYYKHDISGAIADFNEAIRLTPDHADAYNMRGNCYADLRQFDRATEDYSLAIRFKPDFLAAYSNRARSRGAQGDHDGEKADNRESDRLQAELKAGRAKSAN